MSSMHAEASPERIELARAIAASLPKFGHWASTSRQFDTPYGQLGYRRISILWVLRHGMVSPRTPPPPGWRGCIGCNRAYLRARWLVQLHATFTGCKLPGIT